MGSQRLIHYANRGSQSLESSHHYSLKERTMIWLGKKRRKERELLQKEDLRGLNRPEKGANLQIGKPDGGQRPLRNCPGKVVYFVL